MVVWMANTQNSNLNSQTSVVLVGRQELNFRDAASGTLVEHKVERKGGHKSFVMVHPCFHTGQRNSNGTTLSTPSVCTVISNFLSIQNFDGSFYNGLGADRHCSLP